MAFPQYVQAGGVKKNNEMHLILRLKSLTSMLKNHLCNALCKVKKRICSWYETCLESIVRVVKVIKGQLTIDESMALNGILFLSLGWILLAVKQVSETPSWSLIPILGLIPPPPAYISTGLKIILFAISWVLIFAVLWIWRKYKLVNFSKGWLKRVLLLTIVILFLFTLWLSLDLSKILGVMALVASVVMFIAVFPKWLAKKLVNFVEVQLKPVYWMVFLFVYTIGWLRGFSGIPSNSFASNLVFYIGLVWFLIIAIIFWKSAWESGKK